MNMDLKYTELQDDQFGLTVNVKDVLYKSKSEFQTIDIIDTYGLGKMLILDGLVMTSERDEFFYHEMIAHIPMISHPNPKQVLVIGGGDGGTIREVLKHESTERAVLCEIDGEVIEACKKHLPTIAGKLDDPKVEILVQDAIEYIKSQNNAFDVILIDSTDPMGPGEGLFTEEFYNNVKKALRPGGIMAAQSESPFANQKEMKMMYPLLKKVFDSVKTYVGPIPTYPGGYWSWAFCSSDDNTNKQIDSTRAQKISGKCKIYNEEIHRACFCLPNFVKELVGS